MQKIISLNFRIYPNYSQKVKINNNIKCARFVYNKLLDSRIYEYGKFLQFAKRCRKIGLKKEPKKFHEFFREISIPKLKLSYNFLKSADSLALCAEYNNLKNAFNNFFLGIREFPKHKTRKDKNSYITSCVNRNIRIEGGKIRLPKIGFVKIKLHRKLPKNFAIKRVVVNNDKCGRYYINIILEGKIESKEVEFNKIVGLDFKIGDIFVSSNFKKPEYIMPYRKAISRLVRLQKIQKKKRKFSKNWYKILRKIQKLHRKISNKRRDFLHKLSSNLCKKYDAICIESLSMIDIAQKLGRGNNTYDTSYYKFTTLLEYKLKQEGKKLIKVDKWYPSSKLCSNCGTIKSDLSLDDKIYKCSKCGFFIDRDFNAAINIKNEGIRVLNELNLACLN